MEVISKKVQLIIKMAYSGRITPKSVKKKPVTKDANLVGQNLDFLVLMFHKNIIK